MWSHTFFANRVRISDLKRGRNEDLTFFRCGRDVRCSAREAPCDYHNRGGSQARILGAKYYTAPSVFPLRIGNPDSEPRVEFKGYTLLNKLPQFHYSVDGVPVREWIAPLTNELGLCRTFRITDLPQGAWFIAPDAREGRVTSSLGDPVGGKIQIPAGQELIFDVKVLAR